MIKAKEIISMFSALKDKYCVKDVTFKFKSLKKYGILGTYSRVNKIITLNTQRIFELSKEEIEITIIHELAHHFCCSAYGRKVRPHGKEFRIIYFKMLNEFGYTQKGKRKKCRSLSDISTDKEYQQLAIIGA